MFIYAYISTKNCFIYKMVQVIACAHLNPGHAMSFTAVENQT